MLKSSRTWPSIITMAVVQLRLDTKGKTYSAIANVNQSHKQQFNVNHQSTNVKSKSNNSNLNNKKDNQNLCNKNGYQCNKKEILIVNGNKTGSNSTILSQTNGKTETSRHNNHNVNVNQVSPKATNGTVCLCELHYKNKEQRKRSESIKVDNWEYIYKEKQIGNNIHHANCNNHPNPIEK